MNSPTDIDDLIARLEDRSNYQPSRNDMWEAAAALRAQRDEIARLDKEWRKECADADNILFASGLGEDQWRTDGGSLHVPRIVNHFTDLRHRAERAEAERDALRKDAERYRWLRQCTGKEWDDMQNLRMAGGQKNLDAAIDAAITKLEQEQ